MKITKAKYYSSEKDMIEAEIDGVTLDVPTDPDNIHYAEIVKQVADGYLTIADAD